MECTRSLFVCWAVAVVCWAAAAAQPQGQSLESAVLSAPSGSPASPASALPQSPQPQQASLPPSPQPMQPQPLQPQLYPQSPPQLALPLPLSPQNTVLLQCRQTVPSTDLDIAEIQRQILPVSLAGQCLLACAAQRLGYMQPNFPLQMQGAGALMNTLYPSRGFDPTFQNSLMSTVNQCLVQADPLAQLAYSGRLQ
ncbi:homeobox protein Hox-A3-like [Thrips palmi]|uniref:Homeobox protein Hox-A3-like n=1 Tax=Thrips palmi TaxID=161013 RepID=A0A6P8Y6B9_THRPL|nr:homeobox protein Hox-A3-like [Thrips palmi]